MGFREHKEIASLAFYPRLSTCLSREETAELLVAGVLVPGEASALGVGDVEAGADLDYFDLEDLAKLRRHVRRAIEDTQREREIYHDIVLQYFEVTVFLLLRRAAFFIRASCCLNGRPPCSPFVWCPGV